MRQLRAWLVRFRGFFQKAARERELAAEIESHLQMHIDDNIRAGMSPEEARRVALMKLGGMDQAKEAYRDRATIPFLESAVQDLRFTLRQLRKNPAFTITATLMVALGIGASVAIFAFVDAALIKPLALSEPFASPLCHGNNARDSARQLFISRLSRLEEAQQSF